MHSSPFASVLLLLALAFPALGAPAAAVPAAISDPAALLPTHPPAAAALALKLAAFEHDTGLRILVEFHPQSPPEAEDKIPGAYMHALATQLGLAQRGVLVVYFADEDDWRLWIGDDLAARFAGQPGTAAELTKNHAIHHAKEALFAAAHAEAAEAFKRLASAAPPDRPPAHSQHIALEADALLTQLLDRLAAK